MFDAYVMRMSVPNFGGLGLAFGMILGGPGLEYGMGLDGWMIWKGKCTLCSLVFVDEEDEMGG